MNVRVTWLLCAMAWVLPMQAQQDPQSWKLSGFGTLGLAWNNNEHAGFLRDLAQPEGTTRKLDGRLDSRLGLQLNVRLTDSLLATGQVVSKYQYDHTFKPEITWAFLGWNATPDLLVRFGRVGFDLFMDSDSRNVGYSYLWARPPVEHFGGIPVTHLDGIDIANDFAIGDGSTLRLKAFAGLAAERTPVAQNSLNLTGSKLGGLVAEMVSGPWRGRLAYGVLRTRHDFPAPVTELQAGLRQFSGMLRDPRLEKAADDLRFSERTLRFSTATLSYEEGPLQTQAVLGHFNHDTLVAPDSWTGFVSCGYRLGQWVPYGVWSRAVSERPAPDLGMLPSLPIPQAAQLVMGVEQFVASNQMDRYTLAAGVRWDLAAKASLKFQVDRIHSHRSLGLWHLSSTSMGQPEAVDGWSTVASIVLDWVF